MSNSSVFVRSSNCIVFLYLFALSSVVSSDNLVFVVGETSSLQVTPRIEVVGSPGLKQGITSICERLHIHGLQRLSHIDKYAHSLRLIISSNTSNNSVTRTSIDVCFHRNSSRAIGMCHVSQWKRISNGSWVGIISPFDYKIIDIRTFGGSSKVSLVLSAKQELFMYRIVFLIIGIVLLNSASILSKCLAFYYSGAMSIGIFILVITLIINQGLKRLPTRGKSCLELVLYSSMIGVGCYFLQDFCGLIKQMLMQIGISEDLYIPLVILFGAFIFIFGALLGIRTIKNFFVTKDDCVDITASIFVSWSIRVVAVILIIQSSLDPLLAGGALIFGILISSILKIITRKLLPQRNYVQHDETENCSCGLIHATTFASPLPRGINKKPSRTVPLSDSDTFPSSFHKTSEGRRKLTKKEFEKFTRESTGKAMKELVSSADFGEWVVKNAKRIKVNPKGIV